MFRKNLRELDKRKAKQNGYTATAVVRRIGERTPTSKSVQQTNPARPSSGNSWSRNLGR